jgi:hypothetical protein
VKIVLEACGFRTMKTERGWRVKSMICDDGFREPFSTLAANFG